MAKKADTVKLMKSLKAYGKWNDYEEIGSEIIRPLFLQNCSGNKNFSIPTINSVLNVMLANLLTKKVGYYRKKIE